MINNESIYKTKKDKRRHTWYMVRKISDYIFSHAFLAILSFIWLIPVFYLIFQSFRKEPGSFTNYFFPKEYTFQNYVDLFQNNYFNFARWFGNTLLVAVLTCIVSTIFILMVSYTMSRMRFKARKPFMNVALILGMFPGFMTMIAIYYIFKAIGLTQTLSALVIAYSAASGLGYLIAKGFFDTVPKNLDEAAMIDGANRAQIFVKIVLPLSKPIIVYTVLTSFMAPWVDFILAKLIMKDSVDQYTVAIGLYSLLERERIYEYYRMFCAGGVLVSIPIVALFMFMQKYYVEGVTGGSVK